MEYKYEAIFGKEIISGGTKDFWKEGVAMAK